MWNYQKGDRWYLAHDLVALPPRFCTEYHTHGMITLADWINGCAEVQIMTVPEYRELISFEELDAAGNVRWIKE